MADNKLKKATELAEGFLDSPIGKSVTAKPVPKKETWAQKLKRGVKKVFGKEAAAKERESYDSAYQKGGIKKAVDAVKGLVSDKNKENLGEQKTRAGARAGNALTEEEYNKHYGRK